MRKSASSGYLNTEKWVEKTRHSRVFFTDFEVFGYLMKLSLGVFVWLLKPLLIFIILGEIQSKILQNVMLIKIRYPNHRHGSDFRCFLFMNYWWVWEAIWQYSQGYSAHPLDKKNTKTKHNTKTGRHLQRLASWF